MGGMSKKRVITEVDLRRELEESCAISAYVLPEDAIITPAARTLLADRKIPLDTSKGEAMRRAKPEHKTHLRRDVLVPKTHKQIRLRGKLDSFEAKIILAQVRLATLHQRQLVDDLQEVLEAVRAILRAEVREEPLSLGTLMGMTETELHEASHRPETILNVSHFVPEYHMGEEMALLNCLRTEARETELAACSAFMSGYNDGSVRRPDILKALNRLSSALYFMMCRLKSGLFYQGGEETGRKYDSKDRAEGLG